MAFDPKSFNWELVEAPLRSAFELVRSALTARGYDDEVKAAADFLDHGEYGLALEQIGWLILENADLRTADVIAHLRQAGELMRSNGGELDPSLWA